MNTRANIMYFIEHFLDIAHKDGYDDYVRMMQRDIIRVVDAVAPDDGSGAANVKVVRKVNPPSSHLPLPYALYQLYTGPPRPPEQNLPRSPSRNPNRRSPQRARCLSPRHRHVLAAPQRRRHPR